MEIFGEDFNFQIYFLVMGNPYFRFKQFTVFQQHSSMKVGVDGVLLGAWANPGDAQKILDIGTGTGLLSLMLAQKSNGHIIAIEIDQDSYFQAELNFRKSEWNDRLSLYHLSLLEFVQKFNDKYDFIICNPPFFDGSYPAPDSRRNLARHEPTLKLENLFSGVNQLLDTNGRFAMIYPFLRQNDVLTESEKQKLFPAKLTEIKGSDKKKPNRILFEFCRFSTQCVNSELVVRNSITNNYTNEYKELTKDYYLKL